LGTVSVIIGAKTVCFVIFPISIVDITISMDETTFSVCFIALPVALIHGSIDPYLNATSLFVTRLIPLTSVLCSIVEHDLRLGHVALFDILIVDEGSQLAVNSLDQFASLNRLSFGLWLITRSFSLAAPY
jgi:hypothetical protein